MSACGICGTPCPPAFRAPPAELAPDLDHRPGEPTRSTLKRWVMTCAKCGATAPDLAALSPAVSPSGILEKNPFLRWAAIAPDDPEPLLQAAWFADDQGDPAAAKALRIRAADVWGTPPDTASALRLIDVLRRAERFADAAAAAERLAGATLDENSARILAFQRARIAARDSGRHLISSALRPPARTPHAAHGKPAKTFWRRLLGG